MANSPTLDTALQAMIVEQFATDDPAVWADTASDLHILFARNQARLPPPMWQALLDGLEVARKSGACDQLVEAASIAQIELRKMARAKMVDRQRRKTLPPSE